MDCEIILPVENIDVCRYFYRDTVGLGEPEIDSNLLVSFRLNEHTSLVLEKCELPGLLSHASSACRFMLDAASLPGIRERMRKNGTPLADGFTRSGAKVSRGIDPDGNCFMVREP